MASSLQPASHQAALPYLTYELMEVTANLLPLAGLTLGIRHGFDLDHITAINDLVSTKVLTSANSSAIVDQHSIKTQSYILAGMYALGHALVVTTLGLGVLVFRASLPAWIDPMMQKVVGATLFLLGIWTIFCMSASKSSRSRGLMLLHAISKSKNALYRGFLKETLPPHSHDLSDLCNPRCALAIGALHGIGAETGTQVLLMTSIGGSNSLGWSLLMLASFVTGMFIANIGLAVLISESYLRASFSQRLVATINWLAALFSIALGFSFIVGRADFFGN